MHREELACPTSRGALLPRGEGLSTAAGGKIYPQRADWIDFLPTDTESTRGVGPALMHLPAFAKIYESLWRPAFVAAFGLRKVDRERELSWIERELAPAHGGIVVDLSCGPGVIGRRLAASGHFRRVWGLDLSEAMLTQCARFCREEGVEMPLVRADVSYLPFGDATIHGAHAGAALHLWPEPNDALNEVFRVLVPGGVFVASTLLHGDSDLATRAAGVFERATKIRLFSEGELVRMLESAGFTGIRVLRESGLILVKAEKPGRATNAAS